eukprot:scaffold334_cov356-Prasinococcus_capsulatus_cf.AAC.7
MLPQLSRRLAKRCNSSKQALEAHGVRGPRIGRAEIDRCTRQQTVYLWRGRTVAPAQCIYGRLAGVPGRPARRLRPQGDLHACRWQHTEAGKLLDVVMG